MGEGWERVKIKLKCHNLTTVIPHTTTIQLSHYLTKLTCRFETMAMKTYFPSAKVVPTFLDL